MNKAPYFDPWRDRHVINMEPDKMDQFAEDESLFAEQPTERQQAVADALELMPNARYRRLLTGLYCERLSPQILAEEMGVTLPNFYNLHRRALIRLRTLMANKE